MTPSPCDIYTQQQAYYEARADEYDDWFWRVGRYDHGQQMRDTWFRELEVLPRLLREHAPYSSTLELACGTGLWTEHLLRHSRSIHAVDGSKTMLRACEARCGSGRLTLEQADLLTWSHETQYDLVFMGFWISHLLLEQLEEFFQRAANWVKPGGRLMFIDSLYNPQTTASNHNLGAEEHPIRERLLDDGRSFQIVKVFHAPEYLTSTLKAAGFAGAVKTTGEYFYIGSFEKV